MLYIPCWADDERADLIFRKLAFSPYELLQDGYNERKGLAGSSDGLDYDVLMAQEERDGRCLDWGHLGVAHGVDNI